MQNEIKSNKSKILIWGILAVLIIALVMGWGGWVGDLFFAFVAGSVALFVGALVAFLFTRFVNMFEQKWLKNFCAGKKYAPKLKRALSLLTVVVIMLAIIALFLWLLIPRIVEIVTELINDPEAHIAKVRVQFIALFERFGASSETAGNIAEQIIEWVDEAILYIQNRAVDISTTVLTAAGMALISLLFAFLMLKDKEKLKNAFNRYISATYNPVKAEEIFNIKRRSEDILYGYFLGKFVEFLMMSVAAGIIFTIIGVPYAWALAIIVALFNAIPYVGIIIGIIPLVLITFIFGTLEQALIAVVACVVAFGVLGTFISPLIIGNRMRASMLTVCVAVLIGGATFGILGMFFAPPIAAIIVVIWQQKMEVKEEFIHQRLMTEQITIQQNEPPHIEEAQKKSKRKTKKDKNDD